MNDTELQRNYYEKNLDKPSMQPIYSEYVKRHLERVIKIIDLSPQKSLLEIGSGLGKFTLPMLELGYRPTCLDISPLMLKNIQKKAEPYTVSVIESDIAEAAQHTTMRFEHAVGFFTLHHMSDLAKSLQGLDEVLLPGAKAAFCEPRAYNFLYYLQIAMTPRMRWEAEKGIVNMRKSYINKMVKNTSLKLIETVSYGFFPPFVMNKRWGKNLNDKLERQLWLSFGHAFNIFVLEKHS